MARSPSVSMAVNHCLKFYLYSCICACGLVSGPTRQAIRQTYDMPVDPACLGDGEMVDCVTHTVPVVNRFAWCQESREINARNPSSPINPIPFNWGPTPSPTSPPAQAVMSA